MKREDLIEFIKENKEDCYCLIRTNKVVGADEETQRAQLADYIDAGAQVLVFSSDFAEARQNKEISKRFKHLRNAKYVICVDLAKLGSDIFWTLRLMELLSEKNIKVYVDELNNTLDDYQMSYLEFIKLFIRQKKDLEVMRAQIVKAFNSENGRSGGRPTKEIDDKKLAVVISQYENGYLSGKSAATKLGVSESTFRRRLDEFYKDKTL